MNAKKSQNNLISELDETFYYLMRFTKHQIIQESIQGFTLSPPQFGVLHTLKCLGKIPMTELSQHLHLTHGSVTGLVDRLLKLELVHRERSESDRRVVYVSISDRGLELIAHLQNKRYEILEQIVQNFSQEEQDILNKALTLLKEKLINYVENV